MKKLFLILMFAMNLSSVHANEKGNGGGGIKVNGVYKTFYSAGIIINPTPEEKIPGADLYLKTIKSILLIDEKRDSKISIQEKTLLTTALPIGVRRFYRILEESMDKKLMNRLLKEYAKIVGQPKNKQLTIFAFTDTDSKTTYLLPSFYALKEEEQAAILFHEAYWILNPEADYAEVISAEMTFQDFVTKMKKGEYSSKLPRLLSKILYNPSISLNASLINDFRRGIPKMFREMQLRAWLYYTDMDLIRFGRESYFFDRMGTNEFINLVRVAELFPQAEFVKEIIYYMSQEKSFDYLNKHAEMIRYYSQQ